MNRDNAVIKVGLLTVVLSSGAVSAETFNVSKVGNETILSIPDREKDNPEPVEPNDDVIFESLLPESKDKIMADKLIINANLPKSIIVKNSYIVTFKKPKKGEAAIVASSNRINSDVAKRKAFPVDFGKHSSGQDKQELAASINLKGNIVSILDVSSAIHINVGEKEALRLALDKRVLSVEQDIKTKLSTTQSNPGWGLDRIDEQVASTDNTYNYTATGAGRTIYVLDSGLRIGTMGAGDEFGGRASVVWDVNGAGGDDCNGHGSKVSSIIAGDTFGVAKGATIKMAKVTPGCSDEPNLSASITAFNWIATNAPAGSIVNWSLELGTGNCWESATSPMLEQAVRDTHNAGIIVVVAAGNDGCDTSNFSPANIPEAFVVGATSNIGFSANDRKTSFSRIGANIATFAPGNNVASMNQLGVQELASGTSYSAAYISGVFAVACEAAGTLCNSGNTASLYSALKTYGGTLGTVTNTNGSPLTGATSRFISMRW